MGKAARLISTTIALVLTTALPAAAVDQPIDAKKLILKRSSSGKEKLVFQSKDPAFLFPTVGGADDPQAGSPGGATIELVSPGEGLGVIEVPGGLTVPAPWSVKLGTYNEYRYANKDAPGGPSSVRKMRIRDARHIKISGRGVSLPLIAPQGAVAIRITTGSLRNCALFNAATIKKDVAGNFTAKLASTAALSDCSDASLGLIPSLLDRPSDPIVLLGSDVSALTGIAPDDLVAFRYTIGWQQIPVQVDERDVISFHDVYNGGVGCSGCNISVLDYTDAGTHSGPDSDATLDADDEIVFMAHDAGGPAIGSILPSGTLAVGATELVITDPLTSDVGFVYLFEQDGTLDQGAGLQYVDYQFNLLSGDYLTTYNTATGPNPENTTITTPFYARHFSDRWIDDELRVFAGGATGVDILDRHKSLFAPGFCGRSEDTFSAAEGAFVINKSGPVRALRSYVGANSGPLTQRQHHYYARREDITTFLRVHSLGSGIMDFHDYSPAASGMEYLNDLNPGGVTIDGVNDAVTTGEIFGELVRGPQGSIAMGGFVDTSIPLTNVTSYYVDDTTPTDTQCTGDAFAYGSSGVWLNQPLPNTDPRNPPSDHLNAVRIIYYEAPNLPIGQALERNDWLLNPLSVGASAWP